MATTTNYSWTTPDDTALVKDGAAAIRSLGTAIDSTVFTNAGAAVAKATVDAKGDLIAGTADNTVDRLAVGANNTVLTADSSTATGLKWAAPSAAGTSWSLLNAGGTSLTGADTITVSGISGQNSLFIYVKLASSANASSNMRIRFNSDSGSNYDTAGFSIVTSSAYAASNFFGTGGNDDHFPIARMNDSASGRVFAGITVSGANTSGVKVVNVNGGGDSDSSNTGKILYAYNGFYAGSSTISSVSIISSTGNFDLGTIFVYGSAV